MFRRLLPCLLALGLVLLIGCKKPPAAQQARNAPPVRTAAAITRDVPVYLDAIGRTVSVETVTIVPQVGGKIIETNVKDGDFVKRDQILFKIDPRPFEAALASAKATLKQNEAELDLARAEFKRVEELMPTNVVSQLEWDQKKSGLGVAEAKVDAAKAAIRTAELDLEYCVIKSPIEGRAGARWVDPGNIVRANEGTMLIIQELNPIYAEFTVTENDLGTVRKFLASRGREFGNEASMGLKVEVDVPADSARLKTALGPTTQPAPPRSGTLTFLDNTVQASTGTVKLRATVPNPDRYFWPGQFVNVRLVLATKKDAVLVPFDAQQIGQQGPYVYVATPGEVDDPASPGKKLPATIAELRPIRAGQRQGSMLVVDEGLSSGDKVIVSGHMMVVPGSAVTVLPEQPAPQAAQASLN